MPLGETLRLARTERGLTTGQVAEATRIMVQIVEDLERDDFRRIAAPIYGRGFIKLYADLLGLPVEPLVQEFMELYTGARSPQVVRRSVNVETPAGDLAGETEVAAPESSEDPAAGASETLSAGQAARAVTTPHEPDLFSVAAGRSEAIRSVADPAQPGEDSPPRVRPASAHREERKPDPTLSDRCPITGGLRQVRRWLPPGWTLPQAGAVLGIVLLALLLLGLGIRALARARHPSHPSNIRIERVLPPPAPYFE